MNVEAENVEGFEKLYTLTEVATVMRVHLETVRNWVREGRLKALKPGKAYRVRESDLRALMGPTMTVKVETVTEPIKKKKKA